MMFSTANPLLVISKRSLIANMGMDGNVWWVQILGLSSLILKELSSTLHWKDSSSLSSKGLHLPPLLDAKALFSWFIVVLYRQKMKNKMTRCRLINRSPLTIFLWKSIML